MLRILQAKVIFRATIKDCHTQIFQHRTPVQ